jgi:hypothetical protein
MRFTFLLIFMAALGTAYGQFTVATSSSPGTDPTNYVTFRVDKGDLITLSDKKSDDTQFYINIKEAIKQALEEKGYKAVEDSTAQMVISYVGESIARTDTENLGPLGQKPANDGAQVDASRSWSREYTENNLVVEVLDPHNQKNIWRASTTYSGTSLMNIRTLDTIIYKAFRKFPPLRKKKSK